ncbi:MAG TPA: hypothetical protein VFV38_53295, partial [Ktedonobacteraceae bacterium]|nr:hypothetical protein [Ktedonobacteraceae bacterium]
MDPQTSANWISAVGIIVSFVVTLAAVIIAYIALRANNQLARDAWSHTQTQAQEDREHGQNLAREERQHQMRPILVPAGDILYFERMAKETLISHVVAIQNIGNGPAFNIHCALYFSSSLWYSSWNNGPLAAQSQPLEIVFDKGTDNIKLGMKNSVDGTYDLYNDENPRYRAARLTMTYRDLFETMHVSIFDYVVP